MQFLINYGIINMCKSCNSFKDIIQNNIFFLLKIINQIVKIRGGGTRKYHRFILILYCFINICIKLKMVFLKSKSLKGFAFFYEVYYYIFVTMIKIMVSWFWMTPSL